MATANARQSRLAATLSSQGATLFAHRAILWWLPILYLLISDAFYLRTYDSAQIKITLVQMGGICLFSLWACRLIEEGAGAFSKSDLACLAPFLAYFAYGIASFIHAPYKFSSLDFFLRRIFYMTVALIVVREFTESAVSRLIRVLMWTTWITVGYGYLQWCDGAFPFPPGPGNGIDPFIWRGAFGERVFSTFGNPNFFADYLVIMFPVLVMQYLKTRELKLLPLILLLLWDLWGTQTKGAWIGMGLGSVLLVLTYLWYFDYQRLRRMAVYIAAAALVVALGFFSLIFHKLSNSKFTSVNFRIFTWEATWEMIMTQPLRGTGIGSFWVSYPAFRRPPIFHIEGKHNTETDHAEDEYLEVLFDEGILGFGIFLWLIASTCVVAYRALAQMTEGLKPGQRAPPRAYDLLGFLVAFQGMMVHNLFDVSLRFVSSGIYFGLLPGLIVNLSRGLSLQELHVAEPSLVGPEGPSPRALLREKITEFFLWPLRLAALSGLVFMAWRILSQFGELHGPIGRLQLSGEILQWWISWGAFLFCVGSQLGIFGRLVLLSRNALVPVVVGVMVWPWRGPLDLSWGFFRADIHHNMAIFFSKSQNWEQAVKNYLKVGELNPAFVMSYYFKGNVFLDRFEMTKVNNPNWGDPPGVDRDDFERALEAYAQVRANAPNYVQMHHQVGNLRLKMADWLRQHGNVPEAERQLDLALESYARYRNIDPVFPPNYLRIGQIHMMRRQYQKAAETYRAMINAQECEVAPWMLAIPGLRRTLLAYQDYVERDGSFLHLHETSDGYMHLGNALFFLDDLPGAASAYSASLRIDPSNQGSSKNLSVVFSKAQSAGRLKVVGPPPGPGQPPRVMILPK